MKVNNKKLKDNNFYNRLIAYAENFDKVKDINLTDCVKDWISQENYENIKHFLKPSIIEHSLSFTIEDFVFMSPCELAYYQDYYSKILSLLDERTALYQEFTAAIL